MHSYKAIRVVQRPGAQPFYLLALKATELLKWADVPRKKSDYLLGYQRGLDDRHKRITKYLEQSPLNIVPGAIIVATRAGAVSVVDGPDGTTVNVSASETSGTVEALVAEAYQDLLNRLPPDERESVKAGRYDAPPVADDDEQDESEQPTSYLGVLAQELRSACKDWASTPAHRQRAIKENVSSLLKPGLIIDGQHRVFGAKEVQDFDVTLPVVLIPDLPMAEQVFHFYVLNNKAVPLDKTALRGTISTSLSKQEIGDLFVRLEDAGVDAHEAQWTRKLHDAKDSPFKDLVDFGLGDDHSFLKENVLYQVVKAFMRPARKYKNLGADVPSWQSGDDYRIALFFALWNAVKAKYPDAWSTAVSLKGGQILEKASMICLQQFLLDDMVNDIPKRRQEDKNWSPFSSPAELKKSVDGRLHYLPEEFFTKTWTETGLDTKEGRAFLSAQMDEAVRRQGERVGVQSLFRTKKGAKRGG